MNFFDKPKLTLHLKNVEDYFLDECASNEEAIETIYRNALRLGINNIVVIDHENDDYKISAVNFLKAFDIELVTKVKDCKKEFVSFCVKG